MSGGVSEALLKGQSLGLILLKCQELLKNAVRPMSTFDLQLALSNATPSHKVFTVEYYGQLFSDPTFVNTLVSNQRVQFDSRTRKWHFVSPYAEITSIGKLQEYVNKSIDGLELTHELINSHPSMSDWMHTLLEQRKVRAVRTGKLAKCRNFAPDSGFQCDLYESRTQKCDSCAHLDNVSLYPKARTDASDIDFETSDGSFHLDDDIKELWSAVNLPAMEAILEELRTKNQMKQLASKKKPRKRAAGGEVSRLSMMVGGGTRDENAASATNSSSLDDASSSMISARINKVANAHLYSTEDMRFGLSQT